jgi:hypothetical protein
MSNARPLPSERAAIALAMSNIAADLPHRQRRVAVVCGDRHQPGIVMISSRFSLLAAAMVAVVIAAVPADAKPVKKQQRSSIPPFCVLITGPRGWPLPQICEFFDYRQCLQAAADMRGNCVINVDYPYEIKSAPGANWSRP